MDMQLMAWLGKRRSKLTGEPQEPLDEHGTHSEDIDTTQAPSARMPLAIPEAPPEAEPIEEPPVDPRASPETTDMRDSFDRMSNTFLAAGGLPTQAPRGNPYRSERDSMREWLLKKDASRRANEGLQNQESRTGAYLAATQSQREAQMAAQALRAEQEGRREEADAARRELEAEKMRAAKDKETFDQKMAERKMKLEEDRFARKGTPKPAQAPKGFPAGWELEGKTQPTPKQGEQFEGLVYSSEKMKGLTSQMKKELEAVGAGRVLPGNSRIKQLATEIQIEGKNVAELGALSGPDMGLMQSIAADPTKLDSFAKDLPSLLDGLNSWADNSVNAKAKSLGARRSGGVAPSGGEEMIRVIDKATRKPGKMPRSKFNPDKYEMAP